ncbi:MAG: hypothetical protein PF444_02045 [Bacteroidales bacterium]|jgi:hypothetical protein|nr:hypothetical protein [Bacteroidales bacterium]
MYNFNDVLVPYQRKEIRNEASGFFTSSYEELTPFRATVKISGQGDKEDNFSEMDTAKMQFATWRMPDINTGDVICYNDEYYTINGAVTNDPAKLTQLFSCVKLKEKPTNII